MVSSRRRNETGGIGTCSAADSTIIPHTIKNNERRALARQIMALDNYRPNRGAQPDHPLPGVRAGSG
jgi:hypothetical protein